MSRLTLSGEYTSVTTSPYGQKQIRTVVRWRHREGPETVCLAQVSVLPAESSALAVLSEIRLSHRHKTVASDFVGAAQKVLSLIERETNLSQANITWLLHFGLYFYLASPPGESIYLVQPQWSLSNSDRDESEMQRLTPAQVTSVLEQYDLRLDIGKEILSSLGWDWRSFDGAE